MTNAQSRLKLALCGLLTVAAGQPSFAQVNIRQVFSPEKYQELPRQQRETYVAGVLDADRVLFDQTKPMFAACLNGVTLTQVTDVVDVATANSKTREAMPILVHNALVLACERAGHKVQ
ncbi:MULTISPECIES: hypothetical protein [unclassified Cupriavidus]|uniref:hypothetical protein n=1 Tax=unclassified Cupriavidus TaxID=2640874 RepID=UPI00313D2629